MEAFGSLGHFVADLLRVLNQLQGHIYAKLTHFATLTSFDSSLLIKSRVSVHLLVKLIYEGFWESLCCTSHFVANLWGF